MGEAELDVNKQQVIIHSNIITYGNAADELITASIGEEIETLWNEPAASIEYKGIHFRVIFKINTWLRAGITPEEIYQNPDPRNNYFRIEEFAHGNISFVDGIGCNSGYFKLENLYKGSTTAAHEYGHTIGLDHPMILDIRGHGRPGIMYPRGTITDAQFQYDPSKPAGVTGGTMHPMYRRVRYEDISSLKLQKLAFDKKGFAIVGDFSNIYHAMHLP